MGALGHLHLLWAQHLLGRADLGAEVAIHRYHEMTLRHHHVVHGILPSVLRTRAVMWLVTNLLLVVVPLLGHTSVDCVRVDDLVLIKRLVYLRYFAADPALVLISGASIVTSRVKVAQLVGAIQDGVHTHGVLFLSGQTH